jgi:hypothetical protein
VSYHVEVLRLDGVRRVEAELARLVDEPEVREQ